MRFFRTFLEHRRHLALALEVADGRLHLMARGQKLKDGMRTDKLRPARHQNCAHCRLVA
jgi:hypothetical protein